MTGILKINLYLTFWFLVGNPRSYKVKSPRLRSRCSQKTCIPGPPDRVLAHQMEVMAREATIHTETTGPGPHVYIDCSEKRLNNSGLRPD